MSEPAVSTTEPSRAFLATLVALTFVMNTVGRGVTETFAVFLLPVQHGLDVTRSQITATYSVYMLANGLASPFAGQMIDRLGARVTYGFGLSALGLGYVIAGQSTHIAQYYLGAGLLGGLGACALGMVVASSLLSRWFVHRIGSIMSLPYAAIGAGMLVLPPLAQILVQHFEWRTAHVILGLAVLALLPVVMLLPLGRMSRGSPAWAATRAAISSSGARSPWPLSAAMRTSAFWGLFSAYFWTSVAAYAVLPQSVAYLIETGFNPLLSASAFGMIGMLSTLGIVATGWASDRFGRLQTVTLSYVLSMIGATLLILVAWAPSLLLVYGFVLFFGIVQGARGPIIVALVSVLFPGGGVGAIFGALSLALGLGAGAGSWGSGLLHELTGGYVASFGLGILGSLLGMASFWLVPSLRHEQVAADASRHADAP